MVWHLSPAECISSVHDLYFHSSWLSNSFLFSVSSFHKTMTSPLVSRCVIKIYGFFSRVSFISFNVVFIFPQTGRITVPFDEYRHYLQYSWDFDCKIIETEVSLLIVTNQFLKFEFPRVHKLRGDTSTWIGIYLYLSPQSAGILIIYQYQSKYHQCNLIFIINYPNSEINLHPLLLQIQQYRHHIMVIQCTTRLVNIKGCESCT